MRNKLLNKKRGKESVNENEIIPIKIDRDVSFFQDEIMSTTVDTMQVYNDEKDKSKKHRLIFTLYPVFTNILFNKITEVVFKEGSSEAVSLDDDTDEWSKTDSNVSGKIKKMFTPISEANINRRHSIRNTEYSDDRYGLTYHCGIDILNNHLLRSKENISVQKRLINDNGVSYAVNNECALFINDNNSKIIDPFNTIGDYNRNFSGKEDIKIKIPNYNTILNGNTGDTIKYTDKPSPLYIYDTISTFEDTYKNKLQRKDGWLGIKNPSTIRVSVGKDSNYFINKFLNNKDACQFIDFCPERELFSFAPKQNNYRKRLEYNWDYCLTYPYLSQYDGGGILEGKGGGLPLVIFDGGEYSVPYYEDNGISLVMLRSCVKHGLKKNDNVTIKFYDNYNKSIDVRCGVVKTGDFNGKNNEYYFSVRKSDIGNKMKDGYKPKRFLKNVEGFNCEYYFRKFKKFSGKYNNSINTLAFAKTVYGDDVSQIVYTDDINVDGYKDNQGKPLTELYLTFIKKNKGHDLWYEKNIYNNENIEYSRVFGEVTSGLDLPDYVSDNYPIVRKQHNINGGNEISYDNGKVKIHKSSKKLETDITLNSFDEFYGDLVEFNPITQVETVLENVYYRFNTAQRETSNKKYSTIFYDEIKEDVYDAGYGSNTRIKLHRLNEGYANLSPEGYIYKPHHKVKIGEVSERVNELSHDKMEVFEVVDKDRVIVLNVDAELPTNQPIHMVNYMNTNEKYEIIITQGFKTPDYYEYHAKLNKGKTYPTEHLTTYFLQKELGTAPILVKKWSLKKGNELTFKTNTNYSLMFGDIVFLIKKHEVCKYKVVSYIKKDSVYECQLEFVGENNPIDDCEKYYFFKKNPMIPEYAYMLPDDTGTCLWRQVKEPSEYSFVDDLYNIPFTNGAFYHHTGINFYLKRQDPFRVYNMTVEGVENDFELGSTKFDYSFDEYLIKNDSTCF